MEANQDNKQKRKRLFKRLALIVAVVAAMAVWLASRPEQQAASRLGH